MFAFVFVANRYQLTQNGLDQLSGRFRSRNLRICNLEVSVSYVAEIAYQLHLRFSDAILHPGEFFELEHPSGNSSRGRRGRGRGSRRRGLIGGGFWSVGCRGDDSGRRCWLRRGRGSRRRGLIGGGVLQCGLPWGRQWASLLAPAWAWQSASWLDRGWVLAVWVAVGTAVGVAVGAGVGVAVGVALLSEVGFWSYGRYGDGGDRNRNRRGDISGLRLCGDDNGRFKRRNGSGCCRDGGGGRCGLAASRQQKQCRARQYQQS